MIRLLIICLLVSIGYVPSISAYGIVDAPPVEKKSKKRKSKKKKFKFRKIKKDKSIKLSTGLVIFAVVFAVPGVIIAILSSSLPLGILILGLVLLFIALVLCIAALIIDGVEKQKNKDNGTNTKKKGGDSNGGTLGNSSGE